MNMTHQFTTRMLFRCALGFCFAVGSGCGNMQPSSNYGLLELVEVSGKVTLNAQPLAGARVIFEDAQRKTSQAITDSSGNYVLRLDSLKTGVSPGRKIVRITSRTLDEGESLSEGGREDSEGTTAIKPDHVPQQYNSSSQLVADVRPGSDQVFNFDLKSN